MFLAKRLFAPKVYFASSSCSSARLQGDQTSSRLSDTHLKKIVVCWCSFPVGQQAFPVVVGFLQKLLLFCSFLMKSACFSSKQMLAWQLDIPGLGIPVGPRGHVRVKLFSAQVPLRLQQGIGGWVCVVQQCCEQKKL